MSEATKPPPARPARTRLDRLVGRARWIIGVERLWPALVLALCCIAVFAGLGWLGVWIVAPRWLRMAGVLALAAGLGISAWLAFAGRRVSRRDALARLDRDAGLPHRPASSAEDRLAGGGDDPFTRALWELSRRRAEDALARLRLRRPAPRLVDRDPYALRAAALLGLVAAAFVAGDHKDGLIAAAFDWRGALAAAPGFRVDAWVDPPGYTGKPPVVLLAGTGPGAAAPQTVSVPVRSTIVVRSSGEGAVDIAATGGLRPVEAAKPPSQGAAAPAAAAERRFVLEGSGRLTLAHEGRTLAAVALDAVPDRPPTIALVGTLRATDRGGLTLGYRIDDDYGVTGAEADFADPIVAGRPAVRSLVPPPKLALDLPSAPGGLGTGQTTGDLSDHPWAGAEVTMALRARDEGGNVGLSAPLRVTLPARPFRNLLARALVEQRRDLVLDPDHREGLATALEALMIEPDRFGTTKAAYLGLYTAAARLAAARNDTDLIGLADYLWQMALQLEEGDKSAAARDLQAAEQALREALRRGASPDEIKRLTEALRQTMDRFLAEMARKDPSDRAQAQADPNARTITQDQLQQMMKRMQELAQNGDTAEAQRMLDQLQNLLDNLRTAQNGGNQARREMSRRMSELDKMSREQQALRDKTFRQGRSARSPDSGADEPDQPQGDPQQGGDDQAGADDKDLQGQQQALRERLDALQKRMRELGLKGEKGLEDAEQAMKQAEDALGRGKPGNRPAVDAQGRALQGLQQGAAGLSQQMAQQGQGGDRQGEGEGAGGASIGQAEGGQDGTDPLGRPRDGRGAMETRGRALDGSVAERAQRVLQELRRRLGDPSRPTEEMDYLERLLQRY